MTRIKYGRGSIPDNPARRPFRSGKATAMRPVRLLIAALLLLAAPAYGADFTGALSPEEQAGFEFLLRPTSWYLQNLGLSLAIGLVALYAGLRIFARLEGSFVENL